MTTPSSTNSPVQGNGIGPTDLKRQEQVLNAQIELAKAKQRLAANLGNARSAFWQNLLGSNATDWSAFEQQLGYPSPGELTPDYYRTLYDTCSIANRAVKLMAVETWQYPPSVYEDEDADTITPFEEAWDALSKNLAAGCPSYHQDEQGSAIWEYLKRLDILCGVGSFGVLLLGIDDGRNLQDPVDGVQVLAANSGNPIADSPFASHYRNGTETAEWTYLQKDRDSGLVDNSIYESLTTNAAPPSTKKTRPENQPAQRVSKPGPLVPQAQQGRADPLYGDAWGQYGQQPNHQDAPSHKPDPTLPNQGYSDGTVGSPGAGPFVQGTDQQYDRTSGMGMAFPAGAALSGTDQQYFGVQFGPSEEFGPPAKQERRLLFLRVFDESLVQVVRYEWNIRNPRFGLPVMYRITLNDPRQPHSGVGLPLATVYVHWSRVIHAADNLHSSEIFGIPRLRPLLEHIIPLRKIYGADGQAYWKNAFSKLVLSTHPQLGPDVDIESMGGKEAIEAQVEAFNDPTTNQALMLIGATAQTLPPSVTDPTPHVAVHIEAICCQLGIPVPVFKGYEIGEQASENNDEVWNERKRGKQMSFNTPHILVPFIDRLIAIRVLPVPKQKKVTDGKKDGKTIKGNVPSDELPHLKMTPPAAKGAPGGGGAPPPSGAPPAGGKGAGSGSKPGSSPGKPTAGSTGTPKPPGGTSSIKTNRDYTLPVYSSRVKRGRSIYNVDENTPDPRTPSGSKETLVGVQSNAGYWIEWPEFDSLTKVEKAQLALTQVQTDAAYIAGGNDQLFPPKEYLTRIRNYDEEEAEEILMASVDRQQDMDDEAAQMAEEQGLEPVPPPGFQKPQEEIPPHVVLGPGEKLHHPDDIKPGSPLEGQKIGKGQVAPMSHPGSSGGPPSGPPNLPSKSNPSFSSEKKSPPVTHSLRSHHAIKADLIEAGNELARHPQCMPGYGSIDIKNDGSGHVWWTGGDSDGEGFDDVVKDRLLRIAGVTKVIYRQEIPPPRFNDEESGSPLWDEVWVNDGSSYRGFHELPKQGGGKPDLSQMME